MELLIRIIMKITALDPETLQASPAPRDNGVVLSSRRDSNINPETPEPPGDYIHRLMDRITGVLASQVGDVYIDSNTDSKRIIIFSLTVHFL
jgi:hypothetical protein